MKEHKLTDEEFEIECMLLTFDRAIRNAKENGKVCLDFVDVSVLEKLVNICKRQKAEIEALNLINSTYECDTSHIRSVSIKEFAEMLKYKIRNNHAISKYWLCDFINNLVKEMTEDNNDGKRN